MRLLLIFSVVLLLSAAGYAVTDTVAFLNETGTAATAHPWDNITIRITNSAANSNTIVAEAGTITVNSTSDGAGIVVTVVETGLNTGIFEGYFFPQESDSNDAKDWLKAADGGTIYAYADLDRDSSQGEGSISFDVDPDKIRAFSDSSYTINQTEFSMGNMVYLQIASRGGITPNAVSISGNGSLSLTPVESLRGLYRTSFRLSNATNASAYELGVLGGSAISISSDLDGGGQSGTTTLYVRDAAYTYEDSSYSAAESYFKWGSAVYVKVDNALFNTNVNTKQTGYVRVNSTAYPAGITIALEESGVNTGSFRGSFVINDTITTASQIKAAGDDIIKISADLDANDYINATANVTVDNTKPLVSSHEPDTGFLAPSTAREIKINVTDNKQTNLTMKIYYWRGFAAEDSDNDGVLDNGEGTYTVAAGMRNTSSSYIITISDYAVASGGNVSYWIEGTDAAGNLISGSGNWSEPLRTYRLDNTVPTIAIDEPVVSQYVLDSMKINLTFNDTLSGINITTGHYTITKGAAVLTAGDLKGCTKDYCRNTVDISNLTYDYLTLSVSVKDNAGNLYSKDVVFYHHETKVEISKNASLKIIFVPEELSVKQDSKSSAVVSVRNTGEKHLKNLTLSVSGFGYGINRTIKNLSEGSRESFVVDFTAANKTVKTYRIDVKASDAVEKAEDTSSFILKVVPGADLRYSVKKSYSDYTNDMNRLKPDLDYIESKNINATTLRTLYTRTEEKLELARASMNDDYFLAYSMQDEIGKNIADLKKGAGLEKETIGFDWTLVIVILICVPVILFIAYLFWPVPEEPTNSGEKNEEKRR